MCSRHRQTTQKEELARLDHLATSGRQYTLL